MCCKRRLGLLRFTLAVSLVYLAGCSDGPNVVPVSGVIKLDGQPLADVQINTEPIGTQENPNAGSGSFGRTDAQGRYALELVDPKKEGAVVGEHRVKITADYQSTLPSWNDEMEAPSNPQWPREFTDGSLRLTVPAEGTDSADFLLESK